jgi:hypothetical protein
MTMRDLIPWGRGRDMTVRRGEDINPLAEHRGERDGQRRQDHRRDSRP